MSAQSADDLVDDFLFDMMVEIGVEIAGFVAVFAAVFVAWRVLRSDRLANRDGLGRIGTGMGFLLLSMLLPWLLGFVAEILAPSEEAIDDVWYILLSAIPALIGAYFVLSGARQSRRSPLPESE